MTEAYENSDVAFAVKARAVLFDVIDRWGDWVSEMYLAHARTSPPNDRSDHSCRGYAASRENALYSFDFVLLCYFCGSSYVWHNSQKSSMCRLMDYSSVQRYNSKVWNNRKFVIWFISFTFSFHLTSNESNMADAVRKVSVSVQDFRDNIARTGNDLVVGVWKCNVIQRKCIVYVYVWCMGERGMIFTIEILHVARYHRDQSNLNFPYLAWGIRHWDKNSIIIIIIMLRSVSL